MPRADWHSEDILQNPYARPRLQCGVRLPDYEPVKSDRALERAREVRLIVYVAVAALVATALIVGGHFHAG